jgi:hypothetical protein
VTDRDRQRQTQTDTDRHSVLVIRNIFAHSDIIKHPLTVLNFIIA